MDKRITINYLIGTFLLTYIMWGILVLGDQISFLKYGTPVAMILFIIGGNAPPIIAYTVLRKARKITSFKQFAKEAFALKQNPIFYLVLIVFLALFFGIPALMQGVSKGSEFYTGILLIPMMILLGGLEELGWRYILQPSLEKRFPFGIATSLTALIWSIWHLPLFFIAGTSQYGWNFGLFTIMVFGMAFSLATIFYISRSIWMCILFHSMINAFSSTWLIQDSIAIRTCTTAAIIVLSLVLVSYYKKKMGIPNKKANNLPL